MQPRQWGDLFALMRLDLSPKASRDGTRVSVVMQRATLAYLFAQAEDFRPAQTTIAEHLGADRKSVRRAVEVLQTQGLVTTDERLSVVLSEVRRRVGEQQPTTPQYGDSFPTPTQKTEDSLPVDYSAMGTHSPSMGTHSPSMGTHSPLTEKKEKVKRK